MEPQEWHRGRLIDHVQLVVRDLAASRDFYSSIFEVLGVPLSGDGDGFFWADELVVSERERRRLRAGSGRQQHRGRASRAGAAQRTVREDHLLEEPRRDQRAKEPSLRIMVSATKRDPRLLCLP